MTLLEILYGIKNWATEKLPQMSAKDVFSKNYYVDKKGMYIKKDDSNMYPISHPDLSTQPSILPQRFGSLQLEEVLIPNLTENVNFVVDTEIVPSSVTIIDVKLFNAYECIGGYTKKENGVITIYNKEDFVPDYALIRYYGAHGEIITTPARYLTFRGERDNSSFGLNTIATGHKVYYSTDLQYWKPFDTEKDVEINDGEEVYVIGDSDAVEYFNYPNITRFRMAGSISVTGDITSILDYKTLDEKIAPHCYDGMFYNCTALTQAPELPATTLAYSCYQTMFGGCTALTQAPTLPASTLADYCYYQMFSGCTVLTQAPSLPATTLADSCYRNMFSGCTVLTQAPSLPATTLAAWCYVNMFNGCTSLTQAPALPATTLADSCYWSMFYRCTSLTKAPELPATTLVSDCYRNMFNGCTNLSSITCLATDISASNSTASWLSGVAATGTFITANNPPAWSRNDSGIPSGWTVENYIVVIPARYLTFIAGSDNSSFGLKTIATGHNVYYSKDLENWKPFDTEEDVEMNNGEEVYIIGDSDDVSSFDTNNATTFRMAGSIGITGDITSILDYATLNEKISSYCYYRMFSGCTALTQAPTLPATTLVGNCYQFMFQGCTSLTQAPALPATTLAVSCYNQMFNGCTSLTQAPSLPATVLAVWCYYAMFMGCTSLTQAPTLPAVRLANNCYNAMFKDCTNLSSITCLATNISATNPTVNWLSNVAATGTFTKPASMTSWTNGVNGIPTGWTVADYTN